MDREWMKTENIDSRTAASWLAILLVLSPFILFAVPEIIGMEDAYIVRSGSMEPTIPTGSVIWARAIKPENVKEDHIITYESGETPAGKDAYTTHRVVDTRKVANEYQFKTKGDNNEDPDPGWVSGDKVVARHAFTVPMMGYLLNWLGTTQSVIALVVVPATILIFNELYTIGREVYGMKKAGEERDLLETVAIAIAAMIFLATVEMLTGIGSSMLPRNTSVQLGPMAFGGVIMVSLIVSMVLLKFI